MGTVVVNEDVKARLGQDLADAWWARNYAAAVAVIRSEEPVDTGELRATTYIERPVRVPGGWRIRFVAHCNHATVVHQGHGWIYPKRAKALRWVTKAGKVVFASKVRPVKAKPYFYTGFRRMGFTKVTWRRPNRG